MGESDLCDWLFFTLPNPIFKTPENHNLGVRLTLPNVDLPAAPPMAIVVYQFAKPVEGSSAKGR